MIEELLIASFVAVAVGIFTWLFFLRFQGSLLEYRDSYTRETAAKLSELFLLLMSISISTTTSQFVSWSRC